MGLTVLHIRDFLDSHWKIINKATKARKEIASFNCDYKLAVNLSEDLAREIDILIHVIKESAVDKKCMPDLKHLTLETNSSYNKGLVNYFNYLVTFEI